MFRIIKADISIAVHKKGFQITFLIVFLYVILISLYYAYKQRGCDVSFMYHPAVVSGLNEYCDFCGALYMVFPFVVVLPGGFLIFNDRKTKSRIYYLSKTGKIPYYTSKIVTTYCVTFFAMAVPFLLELLLDLILFPQEGGGALSNWPIYSQYTLDEMRSSLFGQLYEYNIYLYTIVGIVIFGMFSGCAAVFALGFTTIQTEYRALFFLPVYVLSWICSMAANLFPGIGFKTDWRGYLLMFTGYTGSNYWYFLFISLAMLLTGVLLIIRNGILRSDGDI